jgi:hypothetical protein
MIEEQERVLKILKGWQWDRKQHGCLFDRGSADSYYGRPRDPHYGGVGGDSGARVEQLSEDEVAEYQAGYTYNELYGDRKDYS